MQHKAEYLRTGRIIKNLADGTTQDFKTVNAAKRWSREWQKKNGGLGIGKLVTASN